MMSNRKFYLFLLSGTFFGMPALAMSAQDSANTHTHTNLLELKPASLEGSFKTASVCFMGFGECDPNIGFGKGDNYDINTENQCKNEGFTKQNCNSVQVIDGVCPYNPAYGNGCKCKPGLITCPAGQTGVGEACNGQYASCQCSPSLVSCASNQNGSGAYCGGRYESCTCKSEYQYTSGNCTYPRSVSGSTCSGMYAGCVCPSGVSAGSFGCAEYYPSPCSGVCKTAYADNCHARTAVSTPYGCATYWSDCTSKCQTAYNDNCRNHDAVISSCPANATCTYFGDCASKISGWTCNSDYTKSGNTCIQNKAKTCEDYGYMSLAPAGKNCVKKFVAELGSFCNTTNCKTCEKAVTCPGACAGYNFGESSSDLYGCPRVCTSCKPICNISEYTYNSCPDGYLCEICSGKYKTTGCDVINGYQEYMGDCFTAIEACRQSCWDSYSDDNERLSECERDCYR